MCHYRFINSNKCPNLVGDVDNERGYASVGTKDIWEISVPSVQYCWEHSTPLKNKVYFLNILIQKKTRMKTNIKQEKQIENI